jgi:hypothetical protein
MQLTSEPRNEPLRTKHFDPILCHYVPVDIPRVVSLVVFILALYF